MLHRAHVDFTKSSITQLDNYLQKPERRWQEDAFKELFTRRGKEACQRQEKWLAFILNQKANNPEIPFRFATMPHEHREWQLLLLSAQRDPKASYTHQILCLLLMNQLFPESKRFDVQPLANAVFTFFVMARPVPQHIHTEYLAAFASAFTFEQICVMLIKHEKGTYPVFNPTMKVVEEQKVLKPLAPRLSPQNMSGYFSDILERLQPSSHRPVSIGSRLDGTVDVMDDSLVQAILDRHCQEITAWSCGILFYLSSRLTLPAIDTYLNLLLNKIYSRNDRFLNEIYRVLIAFHPRLNSEQKNKILCALPFKINDLDSKNCIHGGTELFAKLLALVLPEPNLFDVPKVDNEKVPEKSVIDEDDIAYSEVSENESLTPVEQACVSLISPLIGRAVTLDAKGLPDYFQLLRSIAPILNDFHLEFFVTELRKTPYDLESSLRQDRVRTIVALTEYASLDALIDFAEIMTEYFKSPDMKPIVSKFFVHYAFGLLQTQQYSDQVNACLNLFTAEPKYFYEGMEILAPVLEPEWLNAWAEKIPMNNDCVTLKLIAILTPYVDRPLQERFARLIRESLNTELHEEQRQAWQSGLMMLPYLEKTTAQVMLMRPENGKILLGHQILELQMKTLRQLDDLNPEWRDAVQLNHFSMVVNQARTMCTLV